MAQTVWGDRLAVLALNAGALTLFFAAIAGLLARAEAPRDTSNLPQGMPDSLLSAPFTVLDKAGRAERLGSGNQPLVLIFAFRGDCPPCREQRTLWRGLAAMAERHGVRVVAVTTDPADRSDADSLSLAPTSAIRYAADAEAASRALKTSIMPSTILLDGQRIVAHHRGLMQAGPAVAFVRRLQAQ